MELLVDIFGFLTVLLHGATITAQSIAMGGAIFLMALALPLGSAMGPDAATIHRRARAVTGIAALALATFALTMGSLQSAVVVGTTDLKLSDLWGANFVNAATVKVLAGVALAVLVLRDLGMGARPLLALLIAAILIGSALTSHSVARVDNREPLFVVSVLHQLGAAIWIGGIPCFLIAMAKAGTAEAARLIGRRYSVMSMVGVATLLAGGIAMSIPYTMSFEALIGTAYGAMLSTKVFISLFILALGAMNYLVVERLRRDPATPYLRLRRFAEVEMGLGITIFFVAASLTSLPPAVDLKEDRASVHEVIERITPKFPPRLVSPDRSQLAISDLQRQIDAARAGRATERPQTYVPGSGAPVPRNASDIAWSEYNHHWSGIIVLAIGLLALAEKTGKAPWARHWPLLFLFLAAFLFVRSEAEAWPFGGLTLAESLRDPEFVQHKLFMILITGFSAFEWSVRTGRLTREWARMIFPLICAVGGMMLLTHSHAIDNVKELLLIEITHLPLAVFAIASGWTRWLEMRLPEPDNRLPGWLWPICFCMVGLILLAYREA